MLNKITDLKNLLNFSETLDQGDCWLFRGQSNSDWGLIPSIFRDVKNIDPLSLSRLERDIYRDFFHYSKSITEITDNWHLLTVAQHHGAPTRLLDWTKSLSIAAYFSVLEEINEDAAIWCFNTSMYQFPSFLGRITPELFHRISLIENISKIRPPSFFWDLTLPDNDLVTYSKNTIIDGALRAVLDYTNGFLVILDPSHIDARIKAQQSVLVFYYSYSDSDIVLDLREHIANNSLNNSGNVLTKIIIPKASRFLLKREIERNFNYNWYNLFPDLSGLSTWLRQTRQVKLCKMSEPNK